MTSLVILNIYCVGRKNIDQIEQRKQKRTNDSVGLQTYGILTEYRQGIKLY